jgi:hypothetical protein
VVVRVGKIKISISKKNGKYRVNIVSNEKAGIAIPSVEVSPHERLLTRAQRSFPENN